MYNDKHTCKTATRLTSLLYHALQLKCNENLFRGVLLYQK